MGGASEEIDLSDFECFSDAVTGGLSDVGAVFDVSVVFDEGDVFDVGVVFDVGEVFDVGVVFNVGEVFDVSVVFDVGTDICTKFLSGSLGGDLETDSFSEVGGLSIMGVFFEDVGGFSEVGGPSGVGGDSDRRM